MKQLFNIARLYLDDNQTNPTVPTTSTTVDDTQKPDLDSPAAIPPVTNQVSRIPSTLIPENIPISIPLPLESNAYARKYEMGRLKIYFLSVILELVILGYIALSDKAAWIKYFIYVPELPYIISVLIYAFVVGAIIEIISFPLHFWKSYLWEKKWGLLNQNFTGWLKDFAKGLAVSSILFMIALGIVYLFLAQTKWWWFWSGAILFGCFALLAKFLPIILLPIFFKTKPLPDEELVSRLKSIAAKAGLNIEGIYLWNLGEKTKAANAAFVGTGRTRRVLLSDTLLNKFTREEIEAVFAHELGHWHHKHQTKSLILQGFSILFILLYMDLLLRQRVILGAAAKPDDLLLLPFFLLIISIISILLTPLVNTLIRGIEYQADQFAIELCGGPNSMVSALIKLSRQNLADPKPPRWVEFLFHSHPSIAHRIERIMNQ